MDFGRGLVESCLIHRCRVSENFKVSGAVSSHDAKKRHSALHSLCKSKGDIEVEAMLISAVVHSFRRSYLYA